MLTEKIIIKKIRLVIENSSNTIYKMSILVDGDNHEFEILDNSDQEKALEDFAKQKGITVQQLIESPNEDVKVIRVDNLVTNVDIYVDEWDLINGRLVEKIVVTTSDGKIIIYSKFDEIRNFFIKYCKQEFIKSKEYTLIYHTLNQATRINILEKLPKNLKVNIIQPIYKRIEIIERSNDLLMIPTKIKVVTVNHGEQIYDLTSMEKISDTNPIIEDIYVQLTFDEEETEEIFFLKEIPDFSQIFRCNTIRMAMQNYEYELQKYQETVSMPKSNAEKHISLSKKYYDLYCLERQR